MDKNADLAFNISATANQYSTSKIRFSTQDEGSAKLTFFLFKEGVGLPLNGVTGKIAMRMADGSKFLDTVTLQDKVKGIVEYTLTQEQLKHFGQVVAELYLYYVNGQKMSVHRFSFRIEQALIDTDIQVLTEFYIDDFESLKASILSMADETTNIIDEVGSNVEEAKGLAEETISLINDNNVVKKVDYTKDKNQTNADLATLELKKADQAFVETMLSAAVSGAPKIILPTLSALQAAYPQGTGGTALVLESGHIYIWNGSWIDAGVYQGVEVGEPTKTVIETGEFSGGKQFGFGTNLSNIVSNTNVSFVLNKLLTSKGRIGRVRLNTNGGTIRISVLRMTGTNSFTVLSTTDIPTTAGEKDYETNIDIPEVGLFIALSGAVKFVYEDSTYSYYFWDADHQLTKGENLSGLKQSTAGKITFGVLVDFSYSTQLRKLSESSPVTVARLAQETKEYIKPTWSETSAIFLDYSLTGTLTNANTNKTFIINKALDKSGVIKKVKINSFGTYVSIKLFRKTANNTFEHVSSTDVTTKVGEYEYDVYIPVAENGLYVGCYGNVRYATSPTPTEFYDVTGNENITSGTVTATISTLKTISFGIKLDGISLVVSETAEQIYEEFQTVNTNLSNQVSQISKLNNAVASIQEGSIVDLKTSLRPVWSEGFLTLNPLWIYENCVSAAEGLRMTGAAKAYFNKYLTFDTFYDKVNVIVRDISSVFGIVHNHTVKGAVYIIDGTNKVMNLYYQYTGNSLPGIRASVPLTFDLISGTEYILEVFKTGWKHTFTITDPKTLSKCSVTFDNSSQASSGSYAGKGWGAPGVIQRSGEVIFKRHIYSVGHFPEAKVLFIGDSITEGTNMGAGISIDLRWCSQLRSKLYKGDAIICGRGGSTSSDLLLRLDDLFSIGLKSKIAVVLIGTNERGDSLLLEWKQNIVSIYNKILEKGAIPVIAVPPIPNVGISYITQMRDFILAKGWNTIRFDYATSLNRDGVTYDSTMYTDGVHPNEKGSNAMFQQALIDLGSM